MRVCYFGTYRDEYSRNRIMIEGLRRNGIEVVECHVPLWRGVEDRVETTRGGWHRIGFVWRLLRVYLALLRAYMRVGRYDVLVLGYPGQPDVLLARLLTWLRRKPLVLDVFMSLYLIAQERGLLESHPITGRLIWWLEKVACELSDMLVLDTCFYAAWFEKTYRVAAGRFRLVPTGADDSVLRPVASRHDDGTLHVLYYGSFIPNHGVDYIIEAARLLRDSTHVRFELIGEGPTKGRAMSLVEQYELKNVHFSGWVAPSDLPGRVAQADICLGAFGVTPQSMMTVQNKVYEALAMARPLLTGESEAVSQVFADGTHLALCRREDAEDLARGIIRLADPKLRARLAEQGYQAYIQSFTTARLGSVFRSHLQSLLNRRQAGALAADK